MLGVGVGDASLIIITEKTIFLNLVKQKKNKKNNEIFIYLDLEAVIFKLRLLCVEFIDEFILVTDKFLFGIGKILLIVGVLEHRFKQFVGSKSILFGSANEKKKKYFCISHTTPKNKKKQKYEDRKKKTKHNLHIPHRMKIIFKKQKNRS